jgi:hypothetical protein
MRLLDIGLQRQTTIGPVCVALLGAEDDGTRWTLHAGREKLIKVPLPVPLAIPRNQTEVRREKVRRNFLIVVLRPNIPARSKSLVGKLRLLHDRRDNAHDRPLARTELVTPHRYERDDVTPIEGGTLTR